MPIVALAFHENVAMEKLERYFAAAEAAGGESRAMTCPKCSLAFAVVLVNRRDKRNLTYIGDLQTLIEKDCVSGYHRGEYLLSAGAEPEDKWRFKSSSNITDNSIFATTQLCGTRRLPEKGAVIERHATKYQVSSVLCAQ